MDFDVRRWKQVPFTPRYYHSYVQSHQSDCLILWGFSAKSINIEVIFRAIIPGYINYLYCDGHAKNRFAECEILTEHGIITKKSMHKIIILA